MCPVVQDACPIVLSRGGGSRAAASTASAATGSPEDARTELVEVVSVGRGRHRPDRDLDLGPVLVLKYHHRSRPHLAESRQAYRGARGARADDRSTLIDDGLVRFTAGDGSRDTLVVCGTISAAYGGALGLFEYLSEPVVEDVSLSKLIRHAFESLLAEIAEPGVGAGDDRGADGAVPDPGAAPASNPAKQRLAPLRRSPGSPPREGDQQRPRAPRGAAHRREPRLPGRDEPLDLRRAIFAGVRSMADRVRSILPSRQASG